METRTNSLILVTFNEVYAGTSFKNMKHLGRSKVTFFKIYNLFCDLSTGILKTDLKQVNTVEIFMKHLKIKFRDKY